MSGQEINRYRLWLYFVLLHSNSGCVHWHFVTRSWNIRINVLNLEIHTAFLVLLAKLSSLLLMISHNLTPERIDASDS